MSEIFFDESDWQSQWDKLTHRVNSIQRCRRCLYHADIPGLYFDESGICNYCKIHDQFEEQYGTGKTKGIKSFEQIVKQVKQAGKHKNSDMVIGVSGGTDSSYMLHLTKSYGLKPLASHFDNTWNSTIAVQNIQKLLEPLNIPLETYVVDNVEYDDIYRSFLRAGVIDLESPTDIGLATVLNQSAAHNGVQYVFEGHCYKTEGIFPLGWLYMDARYIASIHRKYGTQPMKTFPNFWLSRQLYWMLAKRIRKIRPLWYLDYQKDEAKELLSKTYGWEWYGGHHLENRMTNFYHSYFLPRRFGIDTRIVGHAALVRSGQLTYAEGLKLLVDPPAMDSNLLDMILKRLQLSKGSFLELMHAPKRSYSDFPTYKPLFKQFRPFFYLMAKLELIPMSFYVKYTS